MRAGLIPSRQLQERRILTQRDEIAKREIREWNGENNMEFFFRLFYFDSILPNFCVLRVF